MNSVPSRPARNLTRALLLIPLLLSCSICQQLTATRVVSATLIHTPKIKPPGLPQMNLELEATTNLLVILGDLKSGLEGQPKPVSGAKVRLLFPGSPYGISMTETKDAPGTFRLISEEDPRLTYLDDQEYRVEVDDGEDIHQLRVTLPKPSEKTGLKPDEITEHAAKADLTLKHPNPEELAFVIVTRSPDPVCDQQEALNPKAETTYTNAPQDVDAVKDLLQNDGKWRTKEIVVPGAQAFPKCGYYLIVLTSMARGEALTSNLFIGSQFLAGKAEGAIYHVAK